MKKLNLKYQGFTIGARVADSVPFNQALMSVRDSSGAVVALHAIKNIAQNMYADQEFGLIAVNGVHYATH